MKLLLVVVLAISCRAQVFEAASVKLNKAGGPAKFWRYPGRLNVTNMTLRAMMRYAYDVRDIQIEGGPPWFDSDHWDISATAGREISEAEREKMLQALLMERFQMKMRRETKQLPIYALVIAKKGLKLKPNTDGKPERVMMRANAKGQMRLECQDVTLARLASALFDQTGRMVFDHTGIPGTFDFQLNWAPDPAHMPSINGAKPEGVPDGPSIFTAVQEQLGLKLESAKGPVEILVIDRAEKATEN